MIHTTTEGQSFDPEILRQELVAALGETGWHINTAGDQVEFVGEGFDLGSIILVHFDNGAAREADRVRGGIRTEYAKKMAAVAAPYKQEERETWFTQLKEADEWLIDNTVATPMLTAMATARGITVAIMVGKVKENDTRFRQAIGALLGEQQRELDLLA